MNIDVNALMIRALGTCTDNGAPPPLGRRLAVIAAGLALMSYGRRRSTVSRIVGGAGAALAARAIAGCDDVARVANWWQQRQAAQRAADWMSADQVDETGDQSFPASDPPSWPASVASTVSK